MLLSALNDLLLDHGTTLDEVLKGDAFVHRVEVIIDGIEGVHFAVRCRRPHETLATPFLFKSTHHDEELDVVY